MEKIRGVNLGNWLVLERWMCPSLFEGIEGASETAFMKGFGDEAAERLTAHRDSWITYKDFEYLRDRGINCVRIPIAHWIFGDYPPNLGCIEYLDKAFQWANKTNIKILIDMHGAPGSQNGDMHSGLEGIIDWPKDDANIQRTIDVLVKLAQRYKDDKALCGIEMLNEPNHGVPNDILRDYYIRCYRALRKVLDESKVIVFHDHFNLESWVDFMQTEEFKNVAVDCHVYQCFAPQEHKYSMMEHIDLQLDDWNKALKNMQKYFKVIVGEWSLAAGAEVAFDGKNEVQIDAFRRAFASAQLIDYEDLDGWFFWSYKVNSPTHNNSWDYAKAVNHQYFPDKLDSNTFVERELKL
jgi:glucan 1,3-beta-glucosidase